MGGWEGVTVWVGGGGRYHGWGLGLVVGVEVVAPLIAVSRAIIQISRLVKVKE